MVTWMLTAPLIPVGLLFSQIGVWPAVTIMQACHWERPDASTHERGGLFVFINQESRTDGRGRGGGAPSRRLPEQRLFFRQCQQFQQFGDRAVGFRYVVHERLLTDGRPEVA